MPDYHIFGGVLRSEVAFPELTEAPSGCQSPRWWLSRSAVAPSRSNLEFLGTADVTATASVTLSRNGDTLQLDFDDTGVFVVSPDGCRIAWTPKAEPDMIAVRRDLLGRVFAVALHQQRVVTLHGSAVDLGGQAIAFLAPKYHGKSTTAAALVDSGATLLADDIVAVTTEGVPRVLPSVPTVQLWDDSAALVAQGAVALADRVTARKVQVRWRESYQTAADSAPLAAIYLLAPVQPDGSQEPRRERVPDVLATVALLGQTKIGTLLGVENRARLLGQLGALVEQVPIFRLEIPRDFARLPELTAKLRGWHQLGRKTRFRSHSGHAQR
jgi:hypothetical protein